jgi:hypothetical protein
MFGKKKEQSLFVMPANQYCKDRQIGCPVIFTDNGSICDSNGILIGRHRLFISLKTFRYVTAPVPKYIFRAGAKSRK